MDSRQIGLGATLLFLSSAVILHTGLVDTRLPVALGGLTALVVAGGAMVAAATDRPGRA